VPLCYLCEKDGADTTEHVVPRCLYPGKLPNNVLTLPAHRACNNLTSKDEEAFRNLISVSIPPGSPGFPLWENTWKAIHRPQAAGMQQAFYRNMISLPVLDPDGEVRPSPIAARLENERCNRVLAKIVKGLFTLRTGEFLPGGQIFWRFGQPDHTAADLPLPLAFSVHDVLDVRWGRAADEPLASLWLLRFHGIAQFSVTTMRRSNPLPAAKNPNVAMVWPGPLTLSGPG
jgi:hypothetical protein